MQKNTNICVPLSYKNLKYASVCCSNSFLKETDIFRIRVEDLESEGFRDKSNEKQNTTNTSTVASF